MGQRNLVVIDDNEDMVRRCREISGYIDEYFSTSMYLAEIDTPEAVTPLFLRNIAISKVIAELEALGLITVHDFDEVAGDNYRAKFLINLRETFDAVRCRSWLSKLTPELRSELETIVLEDTSDDIFADVVEHMTYNFPTDELWSMLYAHHDLITSNGMFKAHFNAVLQLVDQNAVTPTITEHNLNEHQSKLEAFQLRYDKLKLAIDKLTMADHSLNRVALYNYLRGYKLEYLDRPMLDWKSMSFPKGNPAFNTTLARLVAEAYADTNSRDELVDYVSKQGNLVNLGYEGIEQVIKYAEVIYTEVPITNQEAK